MTLGAVGTPLPGVRVRITRHSDSADNNSPAEVLVQGSVKGSEVLDKSTSAPISGDLQIKGDSVFREYWNRSGATAKEFTTDGWFKTGKLETFFFFFCN